jgi:hypothetical protein
MIRMLLALILVMASPALLAAEVAAPAATPGCEQDSTATIKPAATVVASSGRGPAAESSVRPRPSRGGPRWQSLLPGMIR